MSPWYLPVVVNGQMPVTSPSAQSPSPARRCESTGIPWRSGSMPTVSSPMPSTAGPATGRDEQAVAPQLVAVVELQDEVVAVATRARSRRTPSTSSMPSRRRTSPSASPERRGLVGEHALGHVDECHLTAEAAHGLGHLDADRTAAEDQQPAGDRRHRGHLAVRPHAVELPRGPGPAG